MRARVRVTFRVRIKVKVGVGFRKYRCAIPLFSHKFCDSRRHVENVCVESRV